MEPLPEEPSGGSSTEVIVITGASGGMGRATALAFAKQGRPLLLCDFRPEPLDSLAAQIGGQAPVEVVTGDITQPAYLAHITAALRERRIAVLVHAAGVSPAMADGSRVFAINFTATKMLVEVLLPHMAGESTAILIASNSGQLLARPALDRALKKVLRGKRSLLVNLLLRSSRTAYPASKRAVQLYAEAMATEFGRAGARIVSLSPGIIDTDMGRLEQKAGPEMDQMLAVAALNRMGQADEIASVATFLASPAASYITGTDILVDGGTIAGIARAGGIMKVRAKRN